MQYWQNIGERFCLSCINVCQLYRVRGFFKTFLKTPWYRASRKILALTLSQFSFSSLTFIRSFLARNTSSVFGGGKHKPDFVSAPNGCRSCRSNQQIGLSSLPLWSAISEGQTIRHTDDSPTTWKHWNYWTLFVTKQLFLERKRKLDYCSQPRPNSVIIIIIIIIIIISLFYKATISIMFNTALHDIISIQIN